MAEAEDGRQQLRSGQLTEIDEIWSGILRSSIEIGSGLEAAFNEARNEM